MTEPILVTEGSLCCCVDSEEGQRLKKGDPVAAIAVILLRVIGVHRGKVAEEVRSGWILDTL